MFPSYRNQLLDLQSKCMVIKGLSDETHQIRKVAVSQSAITCSKLHVNVETLEQGVKYVQSHE